jgi:alpha/beta hydrolase fold
MDLEFELLELDHGLPAPILVQKTLTKLARFQINSSDIKKKDVSIKSHSYGPHQRHMLDFFIAKDKQLQQIHLPLIFFLYGGGLTKGDKRLEATQGSIYQNVGIYFAEQGFACVTIDYRLCPQHGAVYPSGGEDISLALNFLVNEPLIRNYIDFQRVYLFGTSAGAIHCATYLWCSEEEKTWINNQCINIAGFICANPPSSFDKSPMERMKVLKTYFGDDLRKRDLISLRSNSNDTTPTILMVSEYDLIEEVLEPVSAFLVL